MTYLIYSGAKITLTLRKASDESRVSTEATTLQFLLSQYNIPVPAKLPYSMQPRVDELFSPFLPGDVVTVSPEE
jgi:pilus assembly protein CpaB